MIQLGKMFLVFSTTLYILLLIFDFLDLSGGRLYFILFYLFIYLLLLLLLLLLFIRTKRMKRKNLKEISMILLIPLFSITRLIYI